MPAQTGQTAVLGSARVESNTGQPQNIFDCVCSSAWTSRPISAIYPDFISTLYSIFRRPWQTEGEDACFGLAVDECLVWSELFEEVADLFQGDLKFS